MSEETLLEVEEEADRSTVAEHLRSLADQLDGGDEVTLSGEDGSESFDVPDDLEYELEVERAGEEYELEVELEWGEDEENGFDRGGTFELYEDAGGEWRWRLRHSNGNVIADSGEGYSSRASAENGIESVRTNAPEAEIEEVD